MEGDGLSGVGRSLGWVAMEGDGLSGGGRSLGWVVMEGDGLSGGGIFSSHIVSAVREMR